MKILTLMLTVLILAGCGESEEERNRRDQRQTAACQATDWWALGFEDGVKGLRADQFGKYRRECAPYGVTANIGDYLDGRDDGLVDYCRPQNGYRLGVGGNRYANVCPPDLERPFLDAHKDGAGLRERRAAVDKAENRLSQAKKRANSLERTIADKSTAMISPGTSMEGRINLGVEIKQLTQEKVDLNRSIPQLEAELNEARRELDDYQASIAGRYSS
ncbi:MAG: DUF2799 domain-containing protein [Proteobacteria bacterium]|nr:DUF2799 domain-containing protein [Pseudomonadota bacterium]MCK4866753.1 DUF2799 domain-containing protein [Alphaproteobacteria bacterium]